MWAAVAPWTGGVDAGALDDSSQDVRRPPGRLRKAGSHTNLATALVETGSRMDELIISRSSKAPAIWSFILDRGNYPLGPFVSSDRYAQKRALEKRKKTFRAKITLKPVRVLASPHDGLHLNPIGSNGNIDSSLEKKHRTNEELLAKLLNHQADV
jgi:hypothetical protein